MSQPLQQMALLVTLLLIAGLVVHELAGAAGIRLPALRPALFVGMIVFAAVMAIRLIDLLA